PRRSQRLQGADPLGGDRLRRRCADDGYGQGRQARASSAVERRDPSMTRAIDGLVNVDFADREMPDWMVRVKEDYSKGGESFFKSPELSELLDDMDANGVEKAILMCSV